MDYDLERVWAEIDVANLIFNYRQAKTLAQGRRVMPVIKADAYGHGSVRVAQILAKEGADMFAVAAASEALELKAAGVAADVLILGRVPEKAVASLAQQGVILTVTDCEAARLYSENAHNNTVRVHLKLDTGMSRYGITASKDIEETLAEIEEIASVPHLKIEGMFTHFAVADTDAGATFTQLQIERFDAVSNALAAEGIRFPVYHAANSAGLIRFPQSHYDAVREGLILYGGVPDTDMTGELTVRPVMSLRTRVEQIKTLNVGDTVGYGRAFVCQKPTKIAVISVGYADGLFRNGSGNYQMLIHGKRAAQIGRVCMDISMLDITGRDDVAVGDVVTVFGKDGEGFVSIEEYAKSAGTFNYEALCAVSKRVPRFYV